MSRETANIVRKDREVVRIKLFVHFFRFKIFTRLVFQDIMGIIIVIIIKEVVHVVRW